MFLRREVARVLHDIERGEVTEMDLAKLNSFCMSSLALLGKVQRPVWEKAKRDAEIAGYLHGQVEEWEIADVQADACSGS